MERRKEIVEFAQRGYREGLMTATSGNVSCFDRTSGKLWITPSGLDYGRMTAADIVCIDLEGNVLEKTEYQPSSEWRMHAEIYRAIPTVQTIVHTHSPKATAFAVLRQSSPLCKAGNSGSGIECPSCIAKKTLLFVSESRCCNNGRNLRASLS